MPDTARRFRRKYPGGRYVLFQNEPVPDVRQGMSVKPVAQIREDLTA